MHDLPPHLPPKAAYHSITSRLPLSALFGGVIKFPTKGQKNLPYNELPCTEHDQDCVYEIISTLAENGGLKLLLKKSRLNEVGEQITGLYPLKFVSTIFTNPYLTSCMGQILNDSFKRGGFLDGFGPSLTREAEKGTLDTYLKDFAAEVKVPAADIEPYFKSRDWEGLFRMLVAKLDVSQ